MNTIGYIMAGISLLFPGYEISEYNAKQIQCVAAVVYHEARGESDWGQIAVAHVVMNRVRDKRWPNYACGVALQPHQFTGLPRKLTVAEEQAWENAVDIAIGVVSGIIEDPTHGADHYYAPDLVGRPRWSKDMLFVAGIGGHAFFKSNWRKSNG